MATRHLRAVGAGKPAEKPAGRSKPRAKSVAEAAESGDHRGLLVAMRDRIAKAVSDPDTNPRDLAALTRRLQDIAHEIEAIDQRARQETDEDGVRDDEQWDEAAI